MNKYLLPLLVFLALVASSIVFYLIGKGNGYQKGYDDALNLPHIPDTVYRTKLVTVEKPVPVVQWKEREKLVYVPKDSLIYVHDTIPALPREYKQYSGENYTAQVSGIDPSLDWLNINQQTAYITNTIVKKKRWSWNVTAGPGIYWNGSSIQPGLGITAGFGYNF